MQIASCGRYFISTCLRLLAVVVPISGAFTIFLRETSPAELNPTRYDGDIMILTWPRSYLRKGDAELPMQVAGRRGQFADYHDAVSEDPRGEAFNGTCMALWKAYLFCVCAILPGWLPAVKPPKGHLQRLQAWKAALLAWLAGWLTVRPCWLASGQANSQT